VPATQAGIAAGEFTAESITELFDFIDANHDGVICEKNISLLRGSSTKYWGDYYKAFDNKHPVK
jgi:hypothetical protein